MSNCILIDIEKVKVDAYYIDWEPISFSLQIAPYIHTPVITGRCQKRDDIFWHTIYNNILNDWSCGIETVWYINEFEQPIQYLTITQIVP